MRAHSLPKRAVMGQTMSGVTWFITASGHPTPTGTYLISSTGEVKAGSCHIITVVYRLTNAAFQGYRVTTLTF